MSEIIIKDGDYIKVPFDLSCGSLKVTAVADGKEYDLTPYITMEDDKPLIDEIGKAESKIYFDEDSIEKYRLELRDAVLRNTEIKVEQQEDGKWLIALKDKNKPKAIEEQAEIPIYRVKHD